MLISTKIPRGDELTVVIFANVMAFRFHDAFGQNFGWLYETTKIINKDFKNYPETTDIFS